MKMFDEIKSAINTWYFKIRQSDSRENYFLLNDISQFVGIKPFIIFEGGVLMFKAGAALQLRQILESINRSGFTIDKTISMLKVNENKYDVC
jgi:hypothetical protein